MDIIQADSETLLWQIHEMDYSFIVQDIAEPPFDGRDIVTITRVPPFPKTYPMPSDGYRSYLASSESALFIGMERNRALGFVALSRVWNGFVQIDDLAVNGSDRRRGVGSALLAKSVEHASKSGAAGIRAETQSLNIPACRFYRRNGFELGGFDRFHYGPQFRETALFWYLLPKHYPTRS
jgi:streptothricin acetyltransferase